MTPEVEKKLKAIKTPKDRADFVKFCRSQRYTYQAIGQFLGLTKGRAWQIEHGISTPKVVGN